VRDLVSERKVLERGSLRPEVLMLAAGAGRPWCSIACMVTLSDAVDIASRDNFLAAVSTARADGTIQSSVVNAGVIPDPWSGRDVVGFVTYGKSKLANLRARPQATVTFRAGWQWAAIEGSARIIGPDDPSSETGESLRLLRRQVFSAAGGTHDDWAEYDRVLERERRAVVLVTPAKVYSNR
jgi:PPOX class probable F420-dependent enzyme